MGVLREAAAAVGYMQFSISDSMISEFISGLFVVFALIGVGAFLMLILSGLARRFPYTRIAIALALAPMSLIRFLDNGTESTLHLYAMISILLGITIDGINHILTPKAAARAKEAAADTQHPEPHVETDDEEEPGMIVWEKAE